MYIWQIRAGFNARLAARFKSEPAAGFAAEYQKAV